LFHGLQPRESEELQYENQHDEPDELGKDMLAVDIELTEKILTSALERKHDNSLVTVRRYVGSQEWWQNSL
jgi:hypothetical protein